MFAKALLDGTITLATFEEPAYRDPLLRPLMAKIRVYLDPEVDSMYPKTISLKVKATTKDGRCIELWPRDPLGHVRNPMKDEHVRAKFVQIVEPVFGKDKTVTVLERSRKIRDASSSEVSEALALLDLRAAPREHDTG